jgi:signal transduction histidine kinase
MVTAPASSTSRRLLIGLTVFGLFVLFDIALFGWLIFRALSQREIERVLLETRTEAESLAQQIAARAERQGKDLFTAVALERETQTYIDSVLRHRDIVRTVEIRDKNGTLVFRDRHQQEIPVAAPPPAVLPPRSPELPMQVPPDLRPEPRTEQRTETSIEVYEVPRIEVPIGDLGELQIGISEAELRRRTEVLRQELVRQASWISLATIVLLVSAYGTIWLLLRRGQRLEARAAEAARMAYVGTLASGLAHEIRNPLNSLNLNMQMLEEEIAEHGAPPSGPRLLAITRAEIGRLERLVTDFLAYARPQPLELAEVAAAELLARAREVLAPEAARRGVELEVEDRSGGARFLADREQVHQVLLNFGRNALAATEETPWPRVRLIAVRHGAEVVLGVEDNGVGVPPEEQGRVFDLFYSTRKGGTGLGLAIVERIVKAHGGRVAVESAPGERTVFSAAFPAAGSGPREEAAEAPRLGVLRPGRAAPLEEPSANTRARESA